MLVNKFSLKVDRFLSFTSITDAATDQRLSPSTLLNKSTSDLFSLAHFSSSQTPLSSSISTPTVSQVNPYSFMFQKNIFYL
jgi:hypothetical protein